MTKEIFSVYGSPIDSVIPRGTLSLDEVWEMITDRTLKDQTTALRILLQEGRKEEYKKSKGNLLPSVTFGGVFDYRSTNQSKLSELGKTGLLSASGLVIIDIDHLSDLGLSLEDLRDSLLEDPEIGTRLAFTSPSGDGLKVVCKTSGEITDKDSYKAVYNSLRYYINSKYGEIVDKSGSDICRKCLLCHDPDARILDSESVFNPGDHPVPRPERETPLRDIYNYPDLGEDGIEEIVRRVESSGKDIAPDYADFLKLGYVFANEIGGEEGLSLYKRVCRVHTNRGGYSITDKEIEDQYNKCKGGYSHKGTFVNIAKSMGIDVTKPVEPPQRETRYSQTRTAQRPETPVQSEEEVQREREEKYSKYLEIPSLSDTISAKREGIQTGYRFGESKKEEYLTLRSGAMTLVCGKSSHGKSKLLQNLALNLSKDMCQNGEEGSVLFFTYEEELSDVLIQFANIFANVPGLSQYGTPNSEVIQDYFKTGDLSRSTQTKRQEVLPKLGGYRTLYESGKLRVYYSDLSSQSLCELIEYLSTKIKIKAVFVDYVQLLYRDGNRKERREEIKDICNDLRKTAISLGLPLVLSAQLNRETPNPSEMSEDNIADSADLTRYANTIVCLWNSSFTNVKGGKESYLQTEDGKRLQSRGFTLGEDGKIYAKITKNRGGTPNIDTILNFTGETGYIETNEDLPLGTMETGTLEYD